MHPARPARELLVVDQPDRLSPLALQHLRDGFDPNPPGQDELTPAANSRLIERLVTQIERILTINVRYARYRSGSTAKEPKVTPRSTR